LADTAALDHSFEKLDFSARLATLACPLELLERARLMARELNPAVALQVLVVDSEELPTHALALLSSPRDLASVAGPKAALSAFQERR